MEWVASNMSSRHSSRFYLLKKCRKDCRVVKWAFTWVKPIQKLTTPENFIRITWVRHTTYKVSATTPKVQAIKSQPKGLSDSILSRPQTALAKKTRKQKWNELRLTCPRDTRAGFSYAQKLSCRQVGVHVGEADTKVDNAWKFHPG